jgi:hypothetical protein
MLKAASRLLENSLTACTADLGETSPLQKQMFALHDKCIRKNIFHCDITNLDKVIIRVAQGNNMNRRTAQNQRKVRMPSIIRRRPKKETVEKPVAETTDASCQTTGCGCGN